MWAEPLASRTSVVAWPSVHRRVAFERQEKLARKRLAQRLGFTSMARAPVMDEAGTSMPPAKRSRFATDLERWCTAGSWAMCKHCRVLQPVDMTPTCFDRTPTPLLSEKKCWRCRAHRQHLVPTLDDVPEPLRRLTQSTVAARAVVEVDVGPEVRSHTSNGYRQHAAMIRFAWHASTPLLRIRKLPVLQRAAGKASYKMASREQPCIRDLRRGTATVSGRTPRSR